MDKYIYKDELNNTFNINNILDKNYYVENYIKYILNLYKKFSIEYYLWMLFSSCNDSKYFFENNMHMLENNKLPYLIYKISLYYDNNAKKYVFESGKIGNIYNQSISDCIEFNKNYSYTRYYPTYSLKNIIGVIGQKLNIKYVIVDSPCDKNKKVIYIENTVNGQILLFLRNSNNLNEWDIGEYEFAAISIYNYFLDYYKANYGSIKK